MASLLPDLLLTIGRDPMLFKLSPRRKLNGTRKQPLFPEEFDYDSAIFA